MQTYIPNNIEIFELSASDFLNAEEGSWQADLLTERLVTDPGSTENELEREQEADSLAGFYWWACCPGCLPDGEANGPFETELEAIEDAGGGEYEDDVYALAVYLEVNPAELSEERYKCYGLKVISNGSEEYAIGTDDEADSAWDQALDSYLDDCGVIDSIPDNLHPYFDREAWKRDARLDGRGHALASYDGCEIELEDGFVAFQIN